MAASNLEEMEYFAENKNVRNLIKYEVKYDVSEEIRGGPTFYTPSLSM